jgi:hypothetical protein
MKLKKWLKAYLIYWSGGKVMVSSRPDSYTPLGLDPIIPCL